MFIDELKQRIGAVGSAVPLSFIFLFSFFYSLYFLVCSRVIYSLSLLVLSMSLGFMLIIICSNSVADVLSSLFFSLIPN